jgi:hypothetical protein
VTDGEAKARSTTVTPRDSLPWVRPSPSQVAPTAEVSRRPPNRHSLLWFWPVIGIFLMAAAGETFGPFGALIAGTAALGSLVLYLGGEFFTPQHRVLVTLCTGLAMLLLWYGHLREWPAFTSSMPSEAQATSAIGPLDLSGRRVREADLDRERLRDGRLVGSSLDGLAMAGWDLSHVIANGSSFRRAELSDAELNDADLSGVDLSYARLPRADLRGAVLRGANLRGADLRDACLDGADLTGANLEQVQADGASTTDLTADSATMAMVGRWKPSEDAHHC